MSGSCGPCLDVDVVRLFYGDESLTPHSSGDLSEVAPEICGGGPEMLTLGRTADAGVFRW